MSAVEVQEHIDSPTDKIIRAVTAAIEQYREIYDGDPFLSAVRMEVRIHHPNEERRKGVRFGDVRSVVVEHRSEMRPPVPPDYRAEMRARRA